MATARVIPSTATDWPISIEYVDATNTMTVSPAGKIIDGDDSITFTNNSQNATVNITFELNSPGATLFQPVSPNSTPDIAPGGGSYSPDGPLADNGSVNYYVTVVGGGTFGPYSIQAGDGPLYVSVTGGNSTPDKVAFPQGGSLEMYSTDIDYTVNWTNTGNPLPNPSPGLIAVYVGSSNSKNGPFSNPTSVGPAGPIFGYGLVPPGPMLSGGKGTVIVQ